MTAGLVFLFLLGFVAVDFAEARRGGGGGRVMRGGPAASGAMNRSFARPAQRSSFSTPARNTSEKTPNRDEIHDRREERRDRVEDRYDDRRDWYEDRWRAGAYLSLAAWNDLDCHYTTVVVEGITYYDCDGVRYERVYHGSEVTYIIVN
jgi:hypothetical protein